jgi:O-antigen/teichoic acid export membrane protein
VSSSSESFPPVMVEVRGSAREQSLVEPAAPEKVAAPVESAGLERAARGAFIETAGYVVSLAIRFGSNIVLTRLLQPEVFGLLAMVQLIHFSLSMLADIGLSQAVVQSPKGDDDDYLNTIWSMQLVRGVGLTCALLAITWPAAWWFREPRMLWIVPLSTVNTLVHGFTSSRVFTCQRYVRLWPLLRMEIVTQLLLVSISLIGAYYGYGLIALLLGQIASTALSVLLSHVLPGTTHRDRWHVNPGHRKEILSFGRWIFLSSVLTVVSTRGDSALLGRLLGASNLGLYNLAANIADLPESLGLRVMNAAVYPTLSRAYHEVPQSFSKIFYRVRLYFDALAHTALGGLFVMAGWLIALLYDDRYLAAGSILRAFAVRASFALMAYPWESAFFAKGVTHFQFRRSLLSSVTLLLAMPLGYRFLGASGVIWGTVLARATPLLVLWPAAHKAGWIRYHRELLVPAFFVLGMGLGELALRALQPFFTP